MTAKVRKNQITKPPREPLVAFLLKVETYTDFPTFGVDVFGQIFAVH
jgi:hypothetical protein